MTPGSDVGNEEKRNTAKMRRMKRKLKCDSTKDECRRILEQFWNSTDDVHTFKNNLNREERSAVHRLCTQMGLWSKSFGKGQERSLSVYKTKKKTNALKSKEDIVSFRFSEAAKGVVQDLFSRYPPNDAEMTGNKVGESSGNTDELRPKGDDMFFKPATTNLEISKKVESLASRIEQNPNLRQITEERSKLPIASFRDVITSTIVSNQVVLVCGETGCGKTTQVPQFLLDHAWSKGETCKIVCTQPRRISAISVAERISSERGEEIGDSVGYKIRLESKGGRNSSLVFCTNGVLLRVLVSKGPKAKGKRKKRGLKKIAAGVSDITHIIVDEIHERDRFSDFMLAIIREILPSYPHLRVVLMSATIDAERFSEYFGGCPVIRVPGFTYEVQNFYLEDVLSIVRSTENNHPTCTKLGDTMEDSILTVERKIALDEAIDLALSNDEFDPLIELISSEGNPKIFNYQHSKTGVTPLMVFAGKGRVGDICMLLSSGVDCNLRSIDGKTAFDYAEQDNQGGANEIIKKYMEKTFANSEEEQRLLDKYLSNVNPELIDGVLIEQLLRKICSDSKDGAILIFLPGWDDIRRTQEKLQASPFFRDTSKFMIISLHSMIPSAEQKKVFIHPRPGCRKIVLSTNIAETSVTIDDVVYVLDSGRMKEKSYDPHNNVSTFQSNWISKANAKQRAGRAGRCQPGICYHLYSKSRAASFPDFQVPEIKRMPIEELCLQVKLIDPSCKIDDFLQKTLDPPVKETIRNAIVVLQEIGALTVDEKLTDLGQKLGSLPVHPRTSKMLLLGILLNCLDPALTLACASDYKDPFIFPMLPDQRKKATDAKLELASIYGGNSDQLAVVAAFECWRTANVKGEENRFCSKYFISSNTMRMISGMRKQLEEELIRNGFIPKDTSRCSVESQNPGILQAVLVAGLYPKVGRLVPQGNRSLVETVNGNKVRLQRSTNSVKVSSLIAFDEITCGDGGPSIRSWSVVGSLPVLLLAKEIVVTPSSENGKKNDTSDSKDADLDASSERKIETDNLLNSEKIMSSPDNCLKIFVDSWLPFQSAALDVAQIYCLRERLSAAILFKVTQPNKALPEDLGVSLHALTFILSYDGMSGVSSPPMDALATTTASGNVISRAKQGKKLGAKLSSSTSNNYLKSLMYNNNGSRYINSAAGSQHYHQRGGSAAAPPPPPPPPPPYEVTNYLNAGLPVYTSQQHHHPPITTVVRIIHHNVVPSQGAATVIAHGSATTVPQRNNYRKRKRMLPYQI